jgi:hypothetical protein
LTEISNSYWFENWLLVSQLIVKTMKRIKIISTIFLLLAFGFFAVSPVLAREGIFENIEDCRKTGDCSLCDFLQLFTNLARWILSVMGGVAMIWFVLAGIGFIVSFGNAEKVAENKKAIVGAVFGIIIILAAWLLVNLIFFHLVGDGNTVKPIGIWGDKPWSAVGNMCP